MNISAIGRAAPNLVRICVNSSNGLDFEGVFYHRFSHEGVPFSSPGEMMNKIDALYDEINYPQRTVQLRSFGPEPRSARREPVMARKKVNDLTEQTGERATFVVHVMYRQNATWQGNVLWAEKGQNCNFRSALELLKLMDSALDQTEEPTEEVTEDLPHEKDMESN